MLDTERYRRWVATLAASDAVLVQLALIALASVFVWERLRSMPEPARGYLRLMYAAVALGYLMLQLVTTRGALYLFLGALALSIVARVIWTRRQRRLVSLATKGK